VYYGPLKFELKSSAFQNSHNELVFWVQI